MTTQQLRDEAESRISRLAHIDAAGRVMANSREWAFSSGETQIEFSVSLFNSACHPRYIIRDFTGPTPEAVLEKIDAAYAPVGFDPVLLGC